MQRAVFLTVILSLGFLNSGAFAATRQSSVSAGTKIASATENTVVPTECQDAFYGCMDAFCMLDNAAGGRCQCSDRITELDQALADILKLDEQTYLMATEGVELIQLGDVEAQVVSRANAAASKVVTDNDNNKKQNKTKRTLDLSAWNTVAMIDDDNVFDGFDNDTVSSLADKQGDELFTTSARICASQLSNRCEDYRSMLQLVYSQKVKSDCVAYENSLKLQKNQSQQKLQTAQRALREAALEEYQNQNKYETVGECVIAFTQCIQTTAGCGSDYTGCVILAAQENVRGNASGAKAKQTKIKGAVSGADVTLAASTMNQLLAKKTMCESVTKQCVNANKNDEVWTTFLRNAAPALKSAELVSEQKLRSNCLPAAAECFKNACKDNFGDGDSYDACLSNPDVYKSFCKVQLEPCLEATGGSYDNPESSSLWVALKSLLNSMKVDACTNEITTCLTDRCGEDYSECIGLTTESIVALCPYQKLTACMATKKDSTEVEKYVAEIAGGLAVRVDNALVTACQNAANDAMVRVCGDTESCEGANFDLSSLKYMIKPMACRYNDAFGTSTTCYSKVSQFGNSDNRCGIYATLTDKPAISYIYYSDGDEFKSSATTYAKPEFSEANTKKVIEILNGTLTRVMNSINSDVKVKYCTTGRSVPGFKNFANIDNRDSQRFPHLTEDMRNVIANYLLTKLYEQNAELEDSFADDMDELKEAIDERMSDDSYSSTCPQSSSLVDRINRTVDTTQLYASNRLDAATAENHSYWCTCDKTPDTKEKYESGYISSHNDCLTETSKWRYIKRIDNENKSDETWVYMTRGGEEGDYKGSKPTIQDVKGSYNSKTDVCTIQVIEYECEETNWGLLTYGQGYRCKKYNNGKVISTRTENMTEYLSGLTGVNSGKQKR